MAVPRASAPGVPVVTAANIIGASCTTPEPTLKASQFPKSLAVPMSVALGVTPLTFSASAWYCLNKASDSCTNPWRLSIMPC